MLHFDRLVSIDHYIDYLQKLLPEQEFFVVGGMIRDLLLGRQTNMDDVDIAMAGEPWNIKSLIHGKWKKWLWESSFFDTEKYGTMTVIPKATSDKQQVWSQVKYEITPFRTETSYSDGRHPDEVIRSSSLRDDSQRRDFTINALYYTIVKVEAVTDNHTKTKKEQNISYMFDLESQTLVINDAESIRQRSEEGSRFSDFVTSYCASCDISPSGDTLRVIVDPQWWIVDLLDGKIRAVGSPDARFSEDALRLIRALRFVITLNHGSAASFDIEKATWKSLKKNSYLIRQVAKERIKQEMDKVFDGHNPFGFVSLLDETNMFKWLFPRLYANKNVNQPVRYHPFDVYTHSMMVLYHMQELSTERVLRYAALYHDVGKVEQYSTYAMGLDQDEVREVFGTWLNHVVCGAEFAHEDFKALGMSSKELDQIVRYVANHMKIGEIMNATIDNQRKKIRTMISEVWPEMVKNLSLLTIADRLGQYNPLQPPIVEEVRWIMTMVDDLMAEEGRFTIAQLAVDGNDLMKELNISSWPRVGELLHKAFERVSEDIAGRNNRDIIIQYLS